ncbi:hypothetical protein [Photobacterium satsumensis]|uniref:hypothetical protein n=1 Tax=Photobacterium satsumensis TaxID=2910239 RepID=UPI003D107570
MSSLKPTNVTLSLARISLGRDLKGLLQGCGVQASSEMDKSALVFPATLSLT